MEHEGLFDVSAELIASNASELANNFLARWSDKSWMNTPGPFYCGNGDNCGTGPLCAPNNVHVDPKGFEIIFRQPVNHFELRQLPQAAWADLARHITTASSAHYAPRTEQSLHLGAGQPPLTPALMWICLLV